MKNFKMWNLGYKARVESVGINRNFVPKSLRHLPRVEENVLDLTFECPFCACFTTEVALDNHITNDIVSSN